MVMVPGMTPTPGTNPNPAYGYSPSTGAQPPAAVAQQAPVSTTGSTTQGNPSLFGQVNSGTTDSGYGPSMPAASKGNATIPTPLPPAPMQAAPAATSAPAAPAQPAPQAEAYSGGPLQAVGPSGSQNLIGTQINPSTSPTTNELTGEVAQAGRNVATVGNPDLSGAEKAAFQSWVNESNPVYEQALREATDQAAATGSLGSGQLETGIGSLADTFAQQAMAAETGGQLSALETEAQNANTGAGTLGNLQSTVYGENTTATNQLDQQQAEQAALQQQAITNAENQATTQQSLENQRLANGLAEYAAGEAQSPIATEMGIADTLGSEAGATSAAAGNTLGNLATEAALNPGVTLPGQTPLPELYTGGTNTSSSAYLPVTNDPYAQSQTDLLPPYTNPDQYLGLQTYG